MDVTLHMPNIAERLVATQRCNSARPLPEEVPIEQSSSRSAAMQVLTLMLSGTLLLRDDEMDPTGGLWGICREAGAAFCRQQYSNAVISEADVRQYLANPGMELISLGDLTNEVVPYLEIIPSSVSRTKLDLWNLPLGCQTISSYKSVVKGGQTQVQRTRLSFSIDSWEETFHALSRGVFKYVTWSHVVLAGGSALSALHGINPTQTSYMGVPMPVVEFGDYDFFVVGVSDQAERKKCAWFLMEQIVKGLGEASPDFSGVIVLKATNITLEVENGAKYQIIYDFKPLDSGGMHALNLAHVLHQFDLDSCCIGYDGQKVWASLRGLRALCFGANVVDLAFKGPRGYESRLEKYSRRGFAIFMPGVRQSEYDAVDRWGRVMESEQSAGALKGLPLLAAYMRDPQGVRLPRLDSVGYPGDASGEVTYTLDENGNRVFWVSSYRRAFQAGEALPAMMHLRDLDRCVRVKNGGGSVVNHCTGWGEWVSGA